MFRKNDRVFYLGVGVCEIEEIERKTVVGETRDYYRLRSVDEQNRTSMFLPVDTAQTRLRPLLDAALVDRLLKEADRNPLSWIENDRERQQHFRQILKQGNQLELLRLIIALHRKQEEKAQLGKRLWSVEESILKEGEQQLQQELSYTLKIAQDEVAPYIMKKLSLN